MTLSDFVHFIKRHPDFGQAFVHHRYLAARKPIYGQDLGLHPEIAHILQDLGIERLYRHQVDAIQHIRQGKNVVVATPTASGKSLIYNLSVLEEILEHPDARALYIFPLKALEQDQLKNLTVWL